MYIISIKLAGTEKAGLEVELFEFENNRSESTLGLTMSALLFRSICSVIPVPFLLSREVLRPKHGVDAVSSW